jgi:hypothetical protein
VKFGNVRRVLMISEVNVGMFVYAEGNWHRVLDTRNIDGKTEYLLLSFYFWIADRWVSAEKVENTMVDTGQFN